MTKSRKEFKETNKISSSSLKVEKKKKRKEEENMLKMQKKEDKAHRKELRAEIKRKKELEKELEREKKKKLEKKKEAEKQKELEMERLKELEKHKQLEKKKELEKHQLKERENQLKQERNSLDKKAAKKAAKKLLKEQEAAQKASASSTPAKPAKSSKAVFEINAALFENIAPIASSEPLAKKVAVPIKAGGQKNSNASPSPVVETAAPVSAAVRKPVSIRRPGSELICRQSYLPTYDTNPVYLQAPIPQNVASPDQFILPGINDTEESRILTKTFSDKWYNPAKLYEIEAQTGLKYRRGRFTPEETALAKMLTTKFCQDQGMTLEEFKRVFFDQMGSRDDNQTAVPRRLSNFFVDVAQHFGGRTVVAIYERLRRIYHPGNLRGPWTPEDDETLLHQYERLGPKWTVIGKVLNRLAINCRDRYNMRWKYADQKSGGAWSPEEIQRLIDGVAESLRDSGVITWIWIAEERVKTRSPAQCLSKYKTVSSRGDISSAATAASSKLPAQPKGWSGWKADEDYLLIFAILNSRSASESSINWRTLQVEGIPESRNGHELFFRRWNFLKTKAGIEDEEINLKEQVDRIKRYLVGKSKSAAYILSEDEE